MFLKVEVRKYRWTFSEKICAIDFSKACYIPTPHERLISVKNVDHGVFTSNYILIFESVFYTYDSGQGIIEISSKVYWR